MLSPDSEAAGKVRAAPVLKASASPQSRAGRTDSLFYTATGAAGGGVSPRIRLRINDIPSVRMEHLARPKEVPADARNTWFGVNWFGARPTPEAWIAARFLMPDTPSPTSCR